MGHDILKKYMLGRDYEGRGYMIGRHEKIPEPKVLTSNNEVSKTYFEFINTSDNPSKTGIVIWIVIGVATALFFAIIIGIFIHLRRKHTKRMPDEKYFFTSSVDLPP